MKRIWFFLITFLLLFAAIGSRDTIASLDRAMVHAVGIDKSSEGVSVTLQIFRPEGNGSETTLDPAKANIFVISASAPTVGEAMNKCEDRLGEYLFIGHGQVIVLGNGADLGEDSDLLSYFLKSKESFLGVRLASAEGSAAELLSAELSEGAVAAQSLVNIIKRHAENSSAIDCDLLDAVNARGRCLAMPVLSISGGSKGSGDGQESSRSEKSPEADKTVSADRTQVFIKGKRAFELSGDECMGLALLIGQGERAVIPVGSREGLSAVTVEYKDRDVSLTEEDGRLKLRFSITVTVKRSQSTDLLFDEDTLARDCERLLTEKCRLALEKCTAGKADLFGAADLIASVYPELASRIGDDADRLFSVLDTDAEVTCRIS